MGAVKVKHCCQDDMGFYKIACNVFAVVLNEPSTPDESGHTSTTDT